MFVLYTPAPEPPPSPPVTITLVDCPKYPTPDGSGQYVSDPLSPSAPKPPLLSAPYPGVLVVLTPSA